MALLALGAGCTEDEHPDDLCGGNSTWTPGGAGETDAFEGSTLQYPNGHSMDWHETDPVVIQDELDVIELINDERVLRGLVKLQFDRALARCARGHSRHHYEHGYFQGHVNPEGDDFSSRIVNNGIDTESAGENIVYGSFTALSTYHGWKTSPPHNANMFNPCFIRIGVGRHQDVWTALFAR